MPAASLRLIPPLVSIPMTSICILCVPTPFPRKKSFPTSSRHRSSSLLVLTSSWSTSLPMKQTRIPNSLPRCSPILPTTSSPSVLLPSRLWPHIWWYEKLWQSGHISTPTSSTPLEICSATWMTHGKCTCPLRTPRIPAWDRTSSTASEHCYQTGRKSTPNSSPQCSVVNCWISLLQMAMWTQWKSLQWRALRITACIVRQLSSSSVNAGTRNGSRKQVFLKKSSW